MKKKIKGIAFLLSLVFLLPVCLIGCGGNKKNTYAIKTSKQKYLQGEDIMVTATGKDDAWVAVYHANDDIEKTQYLCWYWLDSDGYFSGETYSLQKTALSPNGQRNVTFEEGDYKVVIYSHNTYSNYTKYLVASTLFSVSSQTLNSVPQAPIKLEYNLKNASDGLADGEVVVSLGENSTASEIILCWANENGFLSDYTELAKFKVSGDTVVCKMYDNTIIPPEATRLCAYCENAKGRSNGFIWTKLPQGCQYDFGGQVLSEFQVVSDIHISRDSHHNASGERTKILHDAHLRQMCADIHANSPNSSGVIIVGDIANDGLRTEWEAATEILGQYRLPARYFSVGNHDLYHGGVNGDYTTQANLFCEFAKQDKVYYETKIGDFYHIILGSEDNIDGLSAYLSDEQLTWFDNHMKEITTAEPNKPVFVYLHQSLYNTIAGSFKGQGWNGVANEEKFKSIIKKYQQIYLFNGHSHWDLNTRGSMGDRQDSLPNIFNTSSVAYLWSSYNIGTGEYLEGSQGYYVKVYSDKVLVLGRDFVNGKWVSSAIFQAKI